MDLRWIYGDGFTVTVTEFPAAPFHLRMSFAALVCRPLGKEEVPMARLARLVIPGLPYHVTQRGNRRGTTFFEDDDFELPCQFTESPISNCWIQIGFGAPASAA